MRYSKLALLSSLSAFALLTATSSPAFAPSVTNLGLLRPQNIWQVSDINAKTASYCAMVSQFDKGISLAFARSPSGSGSLAIGFPSNVLDTSIEYQVTLQVDDLAARTYDVRPASPRSLIIQIGRDEEFYGTMGNNGTLRILMPTMDMRFDLAKFSGSYISLVSCTNNLPHHEGPRTAAMPVEPVEKASLSGDDADARTDLKKKAETKIPTVSSAVPAAAPVPAKTAAKADLANITWTKGNDKNDALFTTSISGGSENTTAANIELKSKISQMNLQQTELTNDANLLKSEKQDLQSKLDMKEKQLQLLEASLNAKDRALASVRSVSNDDSKSLADMQAQLASLKRDRDQAVADLQLKLTEKTAQYDSLQKQFTDASEARRTAQEKFTQDEAELETLRQRLAQGQQQIASDEQQKSDLATQVEFQGQQNRTLLQRVQYRLSKATEQISLLESQLTSVAMQRDDLATQLDTETSKNKALEARLEVKQREMSYNPSTTMPVTGTPAASDNMNLLGYAKSFTAPSSPSQPPTIARDDLLQSLFGGKANAKGAPTGKPVDNWDTVVVQ